jgi:ATP-binding cassette, subfamily B, bacterial
MSEEYFEEEEFTTQFNGRTAFRILALTKPYWKWLLGFLTAIGFVSLLDSYFTFLNKQIVDQAIVAGDPSALFRIGGMYGALLLVQAAGVFAFIYLAGVLGERIRYDLRQKMFDHLQELSLAYYNRTPVGWIMSRVTSDSERVADLVTWGLLDVTWALMNILTAAYFMLLINPRLALIVLVMVPVLVVIAIQFRRRILAEFRLSRKANSRITAAFNETITGVRVVKALGKESENLQEFNGLTQEMFRASYRAAWLSALFLPTVQMISAFALGAVVLYGGLQVNLGAMTIGGIQAFITYITFMLWPIQDLARVYAELQNAIASAERMFSLVDAVPDVFDQPGASDPGTLQGEIVFDNVSFNYDDGKPVLANFNLSIKPGETIALVGPTGGGKSTIVNLLCRFFEPTQGFIRINGVDYRQLSLGAIQSRLGIVLQTPHLFSGTIRENIRYGRLAATDEEVDAASKLAGAFDFIEKLPSGFDEDVGEGGNRLSTGQKQLISLARAVLAQPEIFIMDEATSSVDTLTEALIQKGMENMMKNRTSLIIAHRLSTIRQADRILVIEEGRIVEMGVHAQLIRAQGRYYQLYTRQFRHEREQAYDPFRAESAPAG